MTTECETFIKHVIQLGEKQKMELLQNKIDEASIDLLNEAIRKEIHHSAGINFWQYLLRGFSLIDTQEFKTKRYTCVKTFLNELSSIELPYKLTSDLITRLCSDLNTFTLEQLVEIIEFAVGFLRNGDSKCIAWKDLLPETLLILSHQSVICVNDIKTTGADYRATVIKNLCTMKWPLNIFTPIANMFVDLKLSNDEILVVLRKFAKNIINIAPVELPSLAFQLFTLSQTAAHITVVILAFERFFYKYYYKKLFSDMDSNTTDFNSIDKYSDKELREAEETILHHLSYCTKFTINELQMSIALRNLSSSTELILTPFFISAILSMTAINRDPDDRSLTSFNLLTFLKSVIKTNEDEKELAKHSLWCRDVSQTNTIDIDQVFSVLIDQNKEGKDVITPGLVNLAFACLKSNDSPVLNAIGRHFLQKFIKKRFIFGRGIIKKLADWMILEQESVQYSECLTSLGHVDNFTVSECVDTIRNVLDYFLLIPGIHAMRMISFILPVLKISTRVRDLLIGMLTKAINSKDLNTIQLGVYGFCMLLKFLNNTNSQRSTGIRNFTQCNISGFSFMTQATLKNSVDNPQMPFDAMTLQIIGYLRKCFTAPIEVKHILYENLIRAIEYNSRLTPHILEFVEHHFRSHFEINESESEFKVLFDKLLKINDENESDVEIVENLGELVNLVRFAVITCERHQLNYDTVVIRSILKTIVDKICDMEIQLIDMNSSLEISKATLAVLQQSFLESLMSFCIWTSTLSKPNIENIGKLFKKHKVLSDGLKNYVKSGKKTKKSNDILSQAPGALVKKMLFKAENIWDFPTIERFLRLLFDDLISFAESSETTSLKANRDFVNYVLESTAFHIELIRNQPEYKQVKHSSRVLKDLIGITRLLYERVIKNLRNLWSNFDSNSAYLGLHCFYQSLKTAKTTFHRKFDLFLKGIDSRFANNDKENIVNTIQAVFEESMEDIDEFEGDNDRKIPTLLINCLEILYDFIPFDHPLVLESFIWLNNMCKTYEINSKELGTVLHQLLFSQRLKTHSSGIFFIHICQQLEKILGQIEIEVCENEFTELKSVSQTTAESVIVCLLNVFQKQLTDIEFFIQKCKCCFNKLKIMPDEYQDEATSQLKSMERSISRQLVDLSNQLHHLINVQISLGSCMIVLIKFLISFYNCLTNFTKYFINRSTIQGIKFDQVIKIAGKSISNRVYSLITYIDKKQNFTTTADKKKSNADRSKVLRDTRFLPKLILRLENFNKFIFILNKKIPESDLSKFLHIGTGRDYKFTTETLREAVNNTLDQANEIDDDSDSSGANEQFEDDSANTCEEVETISSESSSVFLHDESDRITTSQFIKNTKTINEKASRIKKSKTVDNVTTSAAKLGKRTTRSSSKCIDPSLEVDTKRSKSCKK